MTRGSSSKLLDFDPEVDSTYRRRLKSAQDIVRSLNFEEQSPSEGEKSVNSKEIETDTMAAQRKTMVEYARPTLDSTGSCVVKPAIEANNFETKAFTMHMIHNQCQFDGLPDEDPHAHIQMFLDICATVKQNGVSEEALKLRLFPFTLRGRARQWFNSLDRDSITTWNQLAETFLEFYFPPSKTAKLRNDITSFTQHDNEPLHEAWIRFKDLLRRCPHHQMPNWLQVSTFYNGLDYATRQTIDAAAGGTLNVKTPEESLQLFENMAKTNHQWSNGRPKQRAAGVYELDLMTTIVAKVDALAKKVDGMALPQPSQYLPVDSSADTVVHEQVDYLGNPMRPQNNLYSNTYNPGWRSHPNFSWSNPTAQGGTLLEPGFQRPPPPSQEKKPNLEELMMKFIQTSETRQQSMETTLRNHGASIHNLETQVGQIAKLLSERPQGSLPGNTEVNPRDQVNVIIQGNDRDPQLDLFMDNACEVAAKEVDHFDKGFEGKEQFPKVKEYVPQIPYPARLNKPSIDPINICKFRSLYDRLHITLPFCDVSLQMARFAKCLKGLKVARTKLKRVPKDALKNKCPVEVTDVIPQKLEDPRSFTIPCIIGNLSFDRALADAGASVNVMPYKLFQRLELGELKPTRGSLQFADRSVKMPRGLVEDVIVRVGHLVFPVDFVVLDMEEDVRVPIILGRSFLATSQAIMDMREGMLTLRAREDELVVRISSLKKEQLSSIGSYVSSVKVIPLGMFSIHDLICRDTLELGKGSEEEEEVRNPKVLERLS